MLFTFDLGHYLSYPFKGREAQKSFLIGCLLILAGFVIPLLPYFMVYGYISKIMEQVIAGEKASMPAWDDWNNLLTKGLRLYGVRIVYSLPIALLVFTMVGIYFGGMILLFSQKNPPAEGFVILVMFFMCVIGLAFPLSILASIISYPAGVHAAAKQEFAAGFRIGEWWPILRHNLGGFALMIGIMYVVSFVVTFAMQIMYLTIILACLLPILMPAYLFYLILVTEPMAAQAYREGRAKLNGAAASPESVTVAGA